VIPPRVRGEPAWELGIRLTAWGVITKTTGFTNSDGFGVPIALTNGTSVVGAPSDHQAGLYSGAAYVFTISNAPFAGRFESGDTSRWSVTVP